MNMSKGRILYLTLMAVMIVGLCVLTASEGHPELIIYYMIGLALLIGMEIVRIVLTRKKYRH